MIYPKIDNPTSRDHYIYQRIVNRWCIFVLALLVLGQALLHFQPLNILGFVFGALVVVGFSGLLAVLTYAAICFAIDWLSGE